MLFFRYLLAACGVGLLLAGLLSASQTFFGRPEFAVGLSVHLVGLGLCWGSLWAGRMRTHHQPGATLSVRYPLSPRSARFHPIIQLIRFGLALVLLGSITVGIVSVGSHIFNLIALQKHGLYKEAQIFNKTPLSELSSSNSGYAYYSFPATSVAVTGELRASRAELLRTRIGSRLGVTYLPTNPRIHRFGLLNVNQVRYEIASTLLVFLTGGVYVLMPFLAFERRLRRQLYLARFGEIITATIISCRRSILHGGFEGYRVRYEFVLPGSRRIIGRGNIRHTEASPTLVGCPITVLYDVHSPLNNRPLSGFYQVEFVTKSENVLAHEI